jgi:hypothetical protein
VGEAGGGELVGEVSWGRRRNLCRLLGMWDLVLGFWFGCSSLPGQASKSCLLVVS